mgnify:CR=1 FL=1
MDARLGEGFRVSTSVALAWREQVQPVRGCLRGLSEDTMTMAAMSLSTRRGQTS